MDIELASLTKLPVVDHVNLKIAAGTYCCLLGPSRLRQDHRRCA